MKLILNALVSLGAFSGTMQAMHNSTPVAKKIKKPESRSAVQSITATKARQYVFGGSHRAIDYKKAYDYYAAVAEKSPSTLTGLNAAQEVAYLYYVGGPGVEKNYIKALMWFERVAARIIDPCLSQSLLKVGLIYYSGGHGIQRDLMTARLWFKKAAEQTLHIGLQIEAKLFLAECEAKIAQGMN